MGLVSFAVSSQPNHETLAASLIFIFWQVVSFKVSGQPSQETEAASHIYILDRYLSHSLVNLARRL